MPRKTTKAGPRRPPSPIFAAAAVSASTALATFGFETLKEAFLPGLTKWESHAATIAAAAAASCAAAFVLASRFRRVNAKLREENAERIAAEESARRALEDKAALLKELQHRAKNSFAMLASLAGIAREDAPEADEALAEMGDRIRAIAELYDMLYSSGSAKEVEIGDYLRRIASALIDRPGIRLAASLDRGLVSADEAIPLGLLVNELATNAVKHAFPGGREGEVRLSASFGEGGLALAFADDGVGMSGSREGGSLGLTLIRSLAGQLGGSCELRSEKGAEWSFRFPGVRRRDR